MSNEEGHDKGPSEELAEIVTNVLLDRRLILARDAQNASHGIASGRLKQEDWRLLIEKALDKESSGEQ